MIGFTRDRERGFTVVEIAVVVPILMVVLLGLFSVLFTYLMSSSREQARLSQEYTQTKAFDRLESDIRVSTAYLAKRDPVNPDPYESFSSGTNTWGLAGTDSSHRVLILREFSTENNPLSNVRTPVYSIIDTAAGCTADNVTQPLTHNVIYFVSGTTLFRRTVVNTTSPRCGNQYQKLSCPDPGTPGLGSRNSTCKADDEVIAQDVAGFSVDYYADQTSTSALDAYTDSSLLSDARSVSLTIRNSSLAYGERISTKSSSRIISGNSQAGYIE